MSENSIAGFVALLGSISQSSQPYADIADYLVSMSAPAVRPAWAQVISVGNILASFALLSAGLWTCLIRVQAGNFSIGCIANNKILQPNAAIGFALGCIGYSSLAIIDLSLALVADHQHVVKPGRAALPGIKFISLWIGCWCFSWSIFGHYTSSRWDPSGQFNFGQAGTSQVPRVVIFALNFTFISSTLFAFISTLATFSIFEHRTQQVVKVISSAVVILRSLDESHRGQPFSLTKAIEVLQPLAGLLPLSVKVVMSLKAGVMVWIICEVLMILAHLAFVYLTFSQKCLMGPTVSFWETLVQVIKDQYPKQASPRINYAREQNVLLILSVMILFTSCLLGPVAVWQYVNTTLEQINTLNYSLRTELVVSCTVSLVTNIVMFKTLAQTRRFARSTVTPATTQCPTGSDDIRMSKGVSWYSKTVPQTRDRSSSFVGPEDLPHQEPAMKSMDLEKRGSQASIESITTDISSLSNPEPDSQHDLTHSEP